ncbi:Zinc finger, CCHC-type [Sesbania bispinosa]|nr:Zinc finger, CCHC-type [Sesbania bispinosa]
MDNKLVKDPAVVKTKGAPPKRKYGRKRRKCSNCNRTGHIISKCPKLYGRDQQKMDDDNEDNGSTPLDEVNVDDMELSDQTQRFNNNEVKVKISGRHKGKGKEKDCTQDVKVKVSGTHEGKEEEFTQQVKVKVNSSHEGKGKECTENVNLNHIVGKKGKEKEVHMLQPKSVPSSKYRPIAPSYGVSFLRPFGNSTFSPGMPSQTMSMPPHYGYVPVYQPGYPMVYPNMVMQNPQVCFPY